MDNPDKLLMQCVGLAGVQVNSRSVPEGRYLLSYNPEARGGMGEAAWTRNPAKAMRFDNLPALLNCWRQVPLNRPVRGDGRPNRPLTAYSVTAVKLSEAQRV